MIPGYRVRARLGAAASARGILGQDVHSHVLRSTQPCIPFIGVAISSTSFFSWGKGGKVTSAGWQVTLCDPVWHVISRSGETARETALDSFTLLYFTSEAGGESLQRGAATSRRTKYEFDVHGGPSALSGHYASPAKNDEWLSVREH
jgi:hypothetical protein